MFNLIKFNVILCKFTYLSFCIQKHINTLFFPHETAAVRAPQSIRWDIIVGLHPEPAHAHDFHCSLINRACTNTSACCAIIALTNRVISLCVTISLVLILSPSSGIAHVGVSFSFVNTGLENSM